MTLNRPGLISTIGIFMCCALFACVPGHLAPQSAGKCSLTVRVTGIRNTTGTTWVVLRRDENTVVEAREVAIDAKTLTAQTTFEKLPDGAYGVSVIHDENKNGKLDFNDVGIPIEGYGHSNNPAKRAGPPSFDETKFNLSGPGTSIEIDLIYWL